MSHDSQSPRFVEFLRSVFHSVWFVCLFPPFLFALLFVFLPEALPDDPRKKPAQEVTDKIEPEITKELEKDAQNVAQAKAMELVDETLEEAVEGLVEEEGSLTARDDVVSAVDGALEHVISGDPQLDMVRVTSIEQIVVQSLTNQLTNLPIEIASGLSTTLDRSDKEELVNGALAEVFAEIVEKDVPLEESSQPKIAEIVDEVVAAELEGFEIPPTVDEEALALDLGNGMTEALVGLEERATNGLLDTGQIGDDDADKVADAVAMDISSELGDIVDQVVETGVDPGNTEAVGAIVESILSEDVGGDVTQAVAPDVAKVIKDSEARLRLIQGLGAGSLSALRDLLSHLIWRLAITIPGPWVVFTFLWEERRHANAQRTAT